MSKLIDTLSQASLIGIAQGGYQVGKINSCLRNIEASHSCHKKSYQREIKQEWTGHALMNQKASFQLIYVKELQTASTNGTFEAYVKKLQQHLLAHKESLEEYYRLGKERQKMLKEGNTLEADQKWQEARSILDKDDGAVLQSIAIQEVLANLQRSEDFKSFDASTGNALDRPPATLAYEDSSTFKISRLKGAETFYFRRIRSSHEYVNGKVLQHAKYLADKAGSGSSGTMRRA